MLSFVFLFRYVFNTLLVTGIDIGYRCKADAECIAGNGGEYSKCNTRVSICICTINHLCKFKFIPNIINNCLSIFVQSTTDASSCLFQIE